MPASEYVEPCGSGYYIAGTRVSLDSVGYALRRGETIDDILADFPALKSRTKLEGVIAFIRAHPREINVYLSESTKLWEHAREQNAPDLIEKTRKYRKERDLKSA